MTTGFTNGISFFRLFFFRCSLGSYLTKVTFLPSFWQISEFPNSFSVFSIAFYHRNKAKSQIAYLLAGYFTPVADVSNFFQFCFFFFLPSAGSSQTESSHLPNDEEKIFTKQKQKNLFSAMALVFPFVYVTRLHFSCDNFDITLLNSYNKSRVFLWMIAKKIYFFKKNNFSFHKKPHTKSHRRPSKSKLRSFFSTNFCFRYGNGWCTCVSVA